MEESYDMAKGLKEHTSSKCIIQVASSSSELSLWSLVLLRIFPILALPPPLHFTMTRIATADHRISYFYGSWGELLHGVL